MTDPTKLLVILGENDALKITLPSGIPKSLEELKSEIQKQCGLTKEFRLQYMDSDFNAFLNVTSTAELKNMDKVKVIYMSVPEPFPEPSPESTLRTSTPTTMRSPESSLSSRYSIDTDILSSPETVPSPSTSSSSLLRVEAWPSVFPIPTFNFEVNMQLRKADQDFHKNGTLLVPTPKLKSDITESLVSEIIKYKAYPSDIEWDDVCRGLITKHPCLKERGSTSGFEAWKTSLKYKMSNYRTKLRGLGCTELIINSLKRRNDSSSPNQVKKPRRAEVNFCPDYPEGEGEESQEEERVTLLTEVQKKHNEEVIQKKMEQTFPHRRMEILKDMPFIAEFKQRWPALFCHREINAEFKRITTMALTSKFMFQLDQHASKMVKIFRKKGGALGQKIVQIMAATEENNTIEVRRSCILKALSVYFNEDPNNLIRQYVDVEFRDALSQMEKTVIGIYVIMHDGGEQESPEDVGIIIEGVTVMKDLRDVATAFSLLFGLIYVLNLNYPPDLKYSFEFYQKVLMELDARKLSKKVQVLKNKLFE